MQGSTVANQRVSKYRVTNPSTYTNTSADGTYIYTSVTVDGYTSGTCPTQPAYLANECHSTTHTPKLYNVIGGTGGWVTGGAAYWSSYLSDTNSQQIAVTPGNEYTFSWDCEVICSFVGGAIYSQGGSGNEFAQTPIQHTYTVNPLGSIPCWISNFFDWLQGGKPHEAEDVDENGCGNGCMPEKGTVLPYGTPVYAMEAGTVVNEHSDRGPASSPYPQCVGAPGNDVVIKGSDGYLTIYYHVTPYLAIGAPVLQGQEIGVTDNSGCQSAGHVHIQRDDPNGKPVNFDITQCIDDQPISGFSDGVIGCGDAGSP